MWLSAYVRNVNYYRGLMEFDFSFEFIYIEFMCVECNSVFRLSAIISGTRTIYQLVDNIQSSSTYNNTLVNNILFVTR